MYRAKDTRLDRTVAVKILPEHLAESPERKERFEREARTISKLNHPHICTLFDVSEHDGIDFLVMECIEGETLASRLARGTLPFGQALDYGAQIASGLDRAHRAGIVHRDLKPGNVMLTKDGLKLLDFGLAKVVEAKGPPPDSRDKRQISTEGGTVPLWGRDSAELFYLDREKVMAVDLESGAFLSPREPRVLFRGDYVHNAARAYDYDKGSERFLMMKRDVSESDAKELHVVTNWFDELRRLSPVQ